MFYKTDTEFLDMIYPEWMGHLNDYDNSRYVKIMEQIKLIEDTTQQQFIDLSLEQIKTLKST